MRALRAGGLVAYPTDTVYGLGTDAFRAASVARLYEVKHRPRYMPLPLLIADLEQLERIAGSVSPVVAGLAQRLWPGAVTLVLRKSSAVPDIVTAGSDKVGVRLPQHPIPVFLARSLGRPLTGTSANVSGRPSCRTAACVREQFAEGPEGVDLIIDGGECPGGIESTVVDVTGVAPNILREGAVSKDVILKAFAEVGACA